jgi:predicted ATPase
MVYKTRDRRCEAELYRLKGELLLAQESKSQKAEIETDSQGEAEACFLKAIEIAQKQQAKSWELRASMNLARLWQQQGKRQAARDMLSSIYNWFAEGFNTADLKDAKALLEELSG